MSRQTEQLVDAIRTKRAHVLHDLGDMWSFREVERRVRRNPSSWLLGGTFVGLLSSRFVLPPLVKRGRRKMGGLLVARMRDAVLALVVGALTRADSNRSGNGSGPKPKDDTDPGSLEEPTTLPGQDPGASSPGKGLAEHAEIR